MNKLKILGFAAAILFGPFLVVYGERDDSPGAQFLGLLIFVFGVWSIIKNRKKNSA